MVSSICVYDAHFVESPQYAGMISLCDQRIEGILSFDEDGYRIWTSSADALVSKAAVGGETDSQANIDKNNNNNRRVHRIARLSSRKKNRGFLDLSHDDDEVDEDIIGNLSVSIQSLRANETR